MIGCPPVFSLINIDVLFQIFGEYKNMSITSPWHSIKQSVHHNNTDCNTGNNIEKENLRQGTGGKPLCKECSDLAARRR